MSKRRVTVIATTAIAGLGAALLSAAAFAPAAATLEPTVTNIPVVTDWHQITLPLDSYQPSTENRQMVLQAEYAETKSCMAKFGFNFQAPSWDKQLATGPISHYRLYGLLDEVHAEQMGYHSYGEKPAAEAKYSKEQHSADYYNVVAAKTGGGVYNGEQIPEGGCIGQARLDIEGPGSVVDLPLTLAFNSWTVSNNDSRVRAGFAAWSKCMSRAGFSYATPMDANNDDRWSGEKATDAEIKVAVTDVNCKKSTNLVGIRMAVDAAHQSVEIATHRSKLQAVTGDLARQLEKANAILSQELTS
jgi:hypothetical protein